MQRLLRGGKCRRKREQNDRTKTSIPALDNHEENERVPTCTSTRTLDEVKSSILQVATVFPIIHFTLMLEMFLIAQRHHKRRRCGSTCREAAVFATDLIHAAHLIHGQHESDTQLNNGQITKQAISRSGSIISETATNQEL